MNPMVDMDEIKSVFDAEDQVGHRRTAAASPPDESRKLDA